MIASLRGHVLAVRNDALIVDVNGVGYQVRVTNALLNELTVGKSVDLFTYMAVRENEIGLYGFRSLEERDLFELLLRVNGIGPRTALGVLSAFAPETLRHLIAQGDAAALTRIPGVGRKTAERLVLDLKDKMGVTVVGGPAPGMRERDIDVINALTALGYSLAEAQQALAAVPEEAQELDQRILAALRSLGGG